MNRVFVKPKEGLFMFHPNTTRKLLPEGESVLFDSFWRRRVAQGDVEIVEVKPEAKPEVKIEKLEEVSKKAPSKKIGGEK